MKKDTVEPNGKWEFDENVSECFDDMLERSIPQYEVMRELVTELAVKHHSHKTDIVDLGASKGRAVEPLISKFGAYNRFVLVEKSPAMLKILNEKYSGLKNVNVVNILDMDLRTDFPACSASVILSILTLMFIPINYRQNILRKIYNSLIPGGALIFVEKVLGETDYLDNIMIDIYHKKKEKSGYTKDNIERKALSLEGVLVPITAKWNKELLEKAGFSKVDCFWRWMNFAGWIAIK